MKNAAVLAVVVLLVVAVLLMQQKPPTSQQLVSDAYQMCRDLGHTVEECQGTN